MVSDAPTATLSLQVSRPALPSMTKGNKVNLLVGNDLSLVLRMLVYVRKFSELLFTWKKPHIAIQVSKLVHRTQSLLKYACETGQMQGTFPKSRFFSEMLLFSESSLNQGC